ncbi:AAA family ATPase [Algiphilus sp.]|uniref:bifunctional aminoglycoside phosphotransferase/ATP-binding protein n=1 Tax=Algiphilus sp. TaxID=1872431 RepID=UPI003B528F15
MTHSDAFDDTLIRSLQVPERFPHSVAEVERIETHGNWILLAGDFAYKIKKPVAFDFMDFSSLERRRYFCEEELRLNRRLAPDIYLRTIAISGSPEQPNLDGRGPAIEYAVVMRRFDPAQRLDRRLQRGDLQHTDLDDLAIDMARFHATLPVADTALEYGAPETLRQLVDDNFRDCAQHLEKAEANAIAPVRARAAERFEALHAHLQRRRDQGCIRECHGDLHLGNLTLHDGRIQAFDCIEFNPALRWIDTANDIAFLLMDLRYRGHPAMAARFRNRYLEWSGDYDAAPLLSFYESYRAMVRAKVALLAAAQGGDEAQVAEKRDTAHRHIQLADRLLAVERGQILVTCGLSGSGKSVVAERLCEVLPAVRLRSDVERKRLFGLDPLADSGSEADAGIYTVAASERLYRHLARTAQTLASAGERVICDATFLKQAQRRALARAAETAGVDFRVLYVHAPTPVLEARIQQRSQAGEDASEADIAILHRQQARAELPDPSAEAVLSIDTTQALDANALEQQLRGDAPPPA